MASDDSEIIQPLVEKGDSGEIKLTFEELMEHFRAEANPEAYKDVSLISDGRDSNSRPAKPEIDDGEIGLESLDYEPCQNSVSAATGKVHTRRHLYGYTGLTLAKWTITICTGLLVGCVAYIIATTQEFIINYKKDWTQKIVYSSLSIAFLGYAAFGILLVLISSCLVLYWAPAAAGGGVTLVMAYLNGNDIPNLLRLRTLITKILGTICTVSSGLPVVIMVEGTGGIDFILPIIMAVVVSNWVAHHIHQHGAYEADLEQSGNVHFLQSEPPRGLAFLTAFDIMSPNVVGFEEVVPVKEVLNVLRSTRHNGFPVFRSANLDPSDAGGKMVGFILRHQLLLLLEQHAFVKANLSSIKDSGNWSSLYYEKFTTKQLKFLEDAMRAYHFCHHPHRRDLTSRPEAVDELDLGGILESHTSIESACGIAEESGSKSPTTETSTEALLLDLRPFMNRAPLTVRGECSAQRVYVIFRTLGLRHLCVTDLDSRVVGMITRKDLSLASKKPTIHDPRRVNSLLRWDSETTIDERTNKDFLYSLP